MMSEIYLAVVLITSLSKLIYVTVK